jgi:hypothetical protein
VLSSSILSNVGGLEPGIRVMPAVSAQRAPNALHKIDGPSQVIPSTHTW